MKSYWKGFISVFLAALLLAGCGVPGTSAPENSRSESSAASDGGISQANSREAVLYIGSQGEFAEFPFSYEGELTPDLLIGGIADLTGWDLALSEPVTTGKGGMTVVFADSCSLLTGPPDPQKEEFHMFDAAQLEETILGSVQHTLQYNFTDPALGSPSALDIYFSGADGQPLYLIGHEIDLPAGEPFGGFTADGEPTSAE